MCWKNDYKRKKLAKDAENRKQSSSCSWSAIEYEFPLLLLLKGVEWRWSGVGQGMRQNEVLFNCFVYNPRDSHSY